MRPVRVTVDADGIVPWGRWAREHRIGRAVRDDLEAGRLSAHWFVGDAGPYPVLALERVPAVTPPPARRHDNPLSGARMAHG